MFTNFIINIFVIKNAPLVIYLKIWGASLSLYEFLYPILLLRNSINLLLNPFFVTILISFSSINDAFL